MSPPAGSPAIALPPPSARWVRGVLLVLAVAAVGLLARRNVHPGQGFDGRYDPDTAVTFAAFEREPGWAAVGAWWVGDGPNGVHTWRPLQYTVLRLEYALFGPRIWPYQVVSLGLLMACAAGVARLLVVTGLPGGWAALAAILTLGWRSPANNVVVDWICTGSELLCGLFSIWAAVALAGWLDGGGRRRLAGCAGLLGLAFLAKEMALGVAVAFIAMAVAWPRRPAGPDRRRRGLAVLACGGVALIWLGLFKLAETRMTIPAELIPPGHTFADLWQRLSGSWVTSLLGWTATVSRPLHDVVRPIVAGAGFEMLFGGMFWRALAILVAGLIGLVWAARRWPRGVVVWVCWNTFTYLPVLPLHDVYPWYLFIPDLLDRGLFVVILLGLGEALGPRWARWRAGHRAPVGKAEPGAPGEGATP